MFIYPFFVSFFFVFRCFNTLEWKYAERNHRGMLEWSPVLLGPRKVTATFSQPALTPVFLPGKFILETNEFSQISHALEVIFLPIRLFISFVFIASPSLDLSGYDSYCALRSHHNLQYHC